MTPSAWKGGRARGVATLMAGTAIGQVVALLAAPVLSRQYDPDEFGVFAVVSGLAVILGTALALRYELAVPLPQEEEDARALVVVGMLACMVSTAALCLALTLTSGPLTRLLDEPRVRPWLVFVPLVAASFALFRLLNQWALRQRRYAATARRNVLQSVTTVLVQVGAGARGAGSGGLIGGLGIGQLVGAAALIPGSGLRGPMARSRVWAVMRRYRRFPLVLAPAGILNAAGVYVPVLLIAGLYGATAAGHLGFTQRILALPVTLVGQAVAQVYLSELAALRREALTGSRRLFTTATVRLALLGGAGALLLLLLAPAVWTVAFGEEWRPAGDMARALSVALAAQLVASPLSQTLVVLERTGWQLAWDVGRLVLVCGAIGVVRTSGGSALTCVWAFSAVSTLAYGVSWWLSRRALATGHAT